MTQHAEPRLAPTYTTPMIDTSVDAETTAPAGGTPEAPPAGWPPSAPMPFPAAPPIAPLNTLAWVSVASAFVVSPVAIVLGAISRRQIARTGERGRGLATTGIALGLVFTLMGVVSTILVLSMVTTVTTTTTAPVAPAPVAAPVQSPAASPAPTGPQSPSVADANPGRTELLSAWLQVLGAASETSANLDKHTGDLNAIQKDFATYGVAVKQFRDVAASASLPPSQRGQVDSTLLPAVDKVLADLDTLAHSQNRSKLQAAATALDADSTVMIDQATAVIGG